MLFCSDRKQVSVCLMASFKVHSYCVLMRKREKHHGPMYSKRSGENCSIKSSLVLIGVGLSYCI